MMEVDALSHVRVQECNTRATVWSQLKYLV